jgi:hypothetical protein
MDTFGMSCGKITCLAEPPGKVCCGACWKCGHCLLADYETELVPARLTDEWELVREKVGTCPNPDCQSFNRVLE